LKIFTKSSASTSSALAGHGFYMQFWTALPQQRRSTGTNCRRSVTELKLAPPLEPSTNQVTVAVVYCSNTRQSVD
jgi:hypothetical protein